MINVLVAGAGKIGSLIAQILASEADYHVYLIDADQRALAKVPESERLSKADVDVGSAADLHAYLTRHQIHSVVACLPYFCNEKLLIQAFELGLNYFDLTEDVAVSTKVKALAKGAASVFMPRCGVAPGLINIMANDLIQQFDRLDTVKLRAGCLPKNVSNPLHYALAWSVDGLINEYGNIGHGIAEGKRIDLNPLDDIESVELDGVQYEAFNTSGGVGELVELYDGKVNVLNYKTLRYPGHCEKMRFLMHDLYLNEDRDTLKKILTRALPQTDQDVMITYVSVSGEKGQDFIEQSRVIKFYPKVLFGTRRSAIQVTTACSASAVIDLVHQKLDQYRGFVTQESMRLGDVMANRFGQLMETDACGK